MDFFTGALTTGLAAATFLTAGLAAAGLATAFFTGAFAAGLAAGLAAGALTAAGFLAAGFAAGLAAGFAAGLAAGFLATGFLAMAITIFLFQGSGGHLSRCLCQGHSGVSIVFSRRYGVMNELA
ncbi:MAG: hypothetical protein PSX71_13050 [bacterium]|nr:hypothetical protein [bacterium]